MKCQDCRWWYKELEMGVCMRFPPQAHPTEQMGLYPVTHPTWGCGEWAPQTMRQVNEKAPQDTPTPEA